MKAFIIKNQKQQLLKFETEQAKKEGKGVDESRSEREIIFRENKDLLKCDKIMILPDELSDDDSKGSDTDQED